MENTSLSAFDMVIWAGAAISVLGLVGLIWCIIRVSRAKRAKLDDDAMREVLRTALPMNLGALFLSVIGLMMVIVGIFLG
jgi:O-antigen/teichoic acid export membrane protein